MDPMPKNLHTQATAFRTLPGEPATSTCDTHFLLAALLLLVAKGDGNISDLESQKMIELLTSRFDMRNSEALASLSSALMTLGNDKGIAQSLRKTGKNLSTAEKQTPPTPRRCLPWVGVGGWGVGL